MAKKRELKARIAQLEAENTALREELQSARYLLDLWYPYPRQYPAANITYPRNTSDQLTWPPYAMGRTDDELSGRSYNVQSIVS
jgi:hypothetical protein